MGQQREKSTRVQDRTANTSRTTRWVHATLLLVGGTLLTCMILITVISIGNAMV